MSGPLVHFERIVRSLTDFPPLSVEADDSVDQPEPHPFESRNIHPDLPARVRKLFDDGHPEQAVFEAFKFIEKEVKRISGITGKTGFSLMMDAFSETNGPVKLNPLKTESEMDEQKGFRFIFTGAATGIRNPRGHEIDLGDTPGEALDYLALASLLLRRLDAADVR